MEGTLDARTAWELFLRFDVAETDAYERRVDTAREEAGLPEHEYGDLAKELEVYCQDEIGRLVVERLQCGDRSVPLLSADDVEPIVRQVVSLCRPEYRSELSHEALAFEGQVLAVVRWVVEAFIIELRLVDDDLYAAFETQVDAMIDVFGDPSSVEDEELSDPSLRAEAFQRFMTPDMWRRRTDLLCELADELVRPTLPPENESTNPAISDSDPDDEGYDPLFLFEVDVLHDEVRAVHETELRVMRECLEARGREIWPDAF